MVTCIRNEGHVPDLESEGVFTKPFVVRGRAGNGGPWYKGLTPFQRMHAHQTLASARRYAYFKQFSGLSPTDELDFILSSSYNHSDETFPEFFDPFMQPETLGVVTWRRLKNKRDLKPERNAKAPSVDSSSTERYCDSHPVLIGGIKERRHPCNIKLMNSSHHSPQTNAGYSRQDKDGTFFQY